MQETLEGAHMTNIAKRSSNCQFFNHQCFPCIRAFKYCHSTLTHVHERLYRKTTTAIPGSIRCHSAGAQICKLCTANIYIHFNCTSQWCFLCRYVKVCTHIQYMVAIYFEMRMTNRPKLNMSKTYPNCFLKWSSSITLFMSSHYVGITLKTSNLNLNVLFKYLWCGH